MEQKHYINILVLIIIVGYIFMSLNIGGYSIYFLDEAKNAECAREMMERGDMIVPTFNGELRTDKPPLHYYFMMAGYKLFGVTPFGARFFSAIFGVLTLVMAYLFTYRFAGIKVAVIAFFIAISSIHLIFQFHWSVPDPYLIFFLNTAFFSFSAWFTERKAYWPYIAFVAMGFGVLTKGPIAIALPGLAVVLYLLFKKEFNLKTILSLKPFHGLAIILLISLPWYLAVHFKTDGAWTQGFFLDHNINRFSRPMEGHGAPFYLPLLIVLLGLMPFSWFIVQAGRFLFQNKGDNFLFFNMMAGIGIILFFSVSGTKLPSYVSPSLPLLSLVLARYFHFLIEEGKLKRNHIGSLIIWGTIGLSLPIAGYFGLNSDPKLSGDKIVALAFVPMGIGALIGIYFSIKKQWLAVVYAASFFNLLTMMAVYHWALPKLVQKNPVAQSFKMLKQSKHIIIAFKELNPAYPFALERVVPIESDVSSLLKVVDADPGTRVVTYKKHVAPLMETGKFDIVFSKEDPFEKPVTLVLKLKGQ